MGALRRTFFIEVDMNIEAYMNTEYRCPVLNDPIRIGQPSPGVDTLLTNQTIQSAAFLTAASPYDKKLAQWQNDHRNALMSIELSSKNLPHYYSVGVEPTGQWQPENSFLVIGIDRTTAACLAIKYEQYAFVFIAKGKPAELVYA